MNRIYLIAIILIQSITLFGQELSTSEKKYEFVNGKEKVTFEILTGNKYLEVNNQTQAKFKFENINPNNVSLAGKTIRILKGNSENELLIEMSPKKEDLEDGKLKIFLSYKSSNEFKNFELKIPVKI
ncbi:hypothetical protein ACFSX9_01530 [Flavobacterium ardleyense]|uniref:Uncharacterized protein n=1 Tax=Flavobacterium ardleyense TaxID=2038737 RepID=A0ABW5Z4L0_9FLAO